MSEESPIDPLPIETKHNKFCSEASCNEQGSDFVKIVVNSGMTGSMEIEVLLCSLHITTLEMGNQGTFLYVRRTRGF